MADMAGKEVIEMANTQIKFTVTDAEHRLLEAEAARKGMSVSALVHDKIFGARSDPRTLVHQGQLRDIHIQLPIALYEKLRKESDEWGYSFSRYITLLLAVKGDPILLEFNPVASSQEIAALHKAYRDFYLVAEFAVKNNDVNIAELRSALLEFASLRDQLSKAILACNMTARELLPILRDELSVELRTARLEEQVEQ